MPQRWSTDASEAPLLSHYAVLGVPPGAQLADIRKVRHYGCSQRSQPATPTVRPAVDQIRCCCAYGSSAARMRGLPRSPSSVISPTDHMADAAGHPLQLMSSAAHAPYFHIDA